MLVYGKEKRAHEDQQGVQRLVPTFEQVGVHFRDAILIHLPDTRVGLCLVSKPAQQ